MYNRLGGNIGLVEMSEEIMVEIDEFLDWEVVEKLLSLKLKLKKKFLNIIRVFVLDVDGVFIEGNVFIGFDGEIVKFFSLRDGMGFELVREMNIDIVVMIFEDSLIVI